MRQPGLQLSTLTVYSVVEIGAPLTPDLVLCIMCEFTASAGIKTARH